MNANLTVDMLLYVILDVVGWHPERLLRTGQCQEMEDTRTGPSMERGRDRDQGSPVQDSTRCTSLPLDCPLTPPQSLLSISNPSQLKIIAEHLSLCKLYFLDFVLQLRQWLFETGNRISAINIPSGSSWPTDLDLDLTNSTSRFCQAFLFHLCLSEKTVT